jgi:hypothetical protein
VVNAALCSGKENSSIMKSAASKMKWSRDVLLSAIKQLEAMHKQNQDPCLALIISRNYRLLHNQLQTLDERKKCLDKAKVWQSQYKPSKANTVIGFFGLSYDSI